MYMKVIHFNERHSANHILVSPPGDVSIVAVKFLVILQDLEHLQVALNCGLVRCCLALLAYDVRADQLQEEEHNVRLVAGGCDVQECGSRLVPPYRGSCILDQLLHCL